jgi:hypothetical protein
MKITCGDKAKIITMAKSGKDSNTIRARFRRYTRQQIAAIMAWITMGKY